MASSSKKEISFGEQKQTISLLKALNDQRKNGTFCDVKLKVCNREFPAHSNILAASSPFMLVKLSGTSPREHCPKSPQTIVIDTKDDTDECYALVLKALLNFMYTGKLAIPVTLKEKLAEIAGVLQMSPVIKFCQRVSKQPRVSLVLKLKSSSDVSEQHLGIKKEDDGEEKGGGDDRVVDDKIQSQMADSGETTDPGVKLGSTGRPKRSLRLQKRKAYSPHWIDVRELEVINAEEQREMNTDGMELPDDTSKKKKKVSYECEKCEYATRKQKEFNEHQDQHKIEENICNFCDQHFESSITLKEHLKKHSGPEPYFCPDCDQRYNTKARYIMHAPVHFKDKPFVCNICGAGFKWKHVLRNHELIHCPEKKLLCDFCGYSTAHRSELKAHRLIHTGNMFSCEILGCTFKATKRQNLRNHMLTHTREKPHQCEICGTAFSMLKNLHRHSKLHTANRPFKCDLCDFSTTRPDKLREHSIKSHSIGEPPKKRQSLMQKYGGISADDLPKEEKREVTSKLAMPFKLIFPIQEGQVSIPALHGYWEPQKREGGQIMDQKFFTQISGDHLTQTTTTTNGQQNQQGTIQDPKAFPCITKVIIPAPGPHQENNLAFVDTTQQFVTTHGTNVTGPGNLLVTSQDTHLVTNQGQKLIVTQEEILGDEGSFQ